MDESIADSTVKPGGDGWYANDMSFSHSQQQHSDGNHNHNHNHNSTDYAHLMSLGSPHHGEHYGTHTHTRNQDQDQDQAEDADLIAALMEDYYHQSNKKAVANIEHQSPIKSVVFNMLNAIIGAGIVGLPFVYNKAGLLGGLLLMFVFAFLSGYTLRLLMIAAQRVRKHNFEDLCEHCFGLYGYWIVSLSMLVFDFGAITSYLIILGDSIAEIISIYGYKSDNDRRVVVCVYAVVFILPACLPRTISKIEKLSAFSVLTVVVINAIVLYEWCEYRLLLRRPDVYTERFPDTHEIQYFVRLSGMSEAIGIIAFAFVMHDMSFLFYNTLRDPTIKRWTLLSYLGCFCAVFVSMLFSVPGYLTFGDDIKDNILNNYKTKETVIIVARVIYTITMSFTYPCSFFVVRHVLYAIFHHGPHYESILKCSLTKHLLFTIPLFMVSLGIGLYVTNLGLVMSVSGSLSAVVLAFVLPCACYLKVGQPFQLRFWREHDYNNYDDSNLQQIWNAFKSVCFPFLLMVTGVAIAVLSTAYTLISAIR